MVMKRTNKLAIAGLLTLSFSAVAPAQTIPPAVPPPLPGPYEVIVNHGLVTGTLRVPEVMLPPPGPQRDRLNGQYPTREVEYKHYLILLKNQAGEFAQCAGVFFGTRYFYYNSLLNQLALDLLVNDRDALQILRQNRNSVGLPAYLGGCTAITAAEAGQLTTNHFAIKIGDVIEAGFDFPLYGTETPTETAHKENMIANGRSISLLWALGRCRDAGWNDSHANAQPGQQITPRALCPR
jgi:hypothetical protein